MIFISLPDFTVLGNAIRGKLLFERTFTPKFSGEMQEE